MAEGSPPSQSSGIFRDPLFHFAVIGLAFFVGFVFINDTQTSRDQITVSVAQQEQLVAAYTRVWRRPPTGEELKGLLDDWVREEIANREAIAMGLASNDLVVRRRLRQKYESFMDQIAASVEPAENELQIWYSANADAYRQDARYTLRQRFFSSDRREDAKTDAETALLTLDIQNPELRDELGDALALAQRFENERASEIGNRFGPAFVDGIENLPEGRWSGPIPSAYGYHLVYIESATNSLQPALQDVKDSVLRDWRAQQIDAARDALYASLLQRYDVKIQAVPADS
ncbi:peptidylprolyl isomerase [Congregibacter variabilis]|uniref:peptidylprolyl isomerase n=1 Tax=Congregibacter variabilis TaxID=3081200 RepID=A0ABZ0I0X8_9GAMM|nr:peptidylprolyl isomerase [Congregibacter sp. IMCC43200]